MLRDTQRQGFLAEFRCRALDARDDVAHGHPLLQEVVHQIGHLRQSSPVKQHLLNRSSRERFVGDFVLLAGRVVDRVKFINTTGDSLGAFGHNRVRFLHERHAIPLCS